MVIDTFQCARHSLVSSVYYRANHGWTCRKLFKTKVLRWLENAILSLEFANTVNTSFNYNTFFQLFYKHYSVFNSSTITWFWRCKGRILLEFSQVPKVGSITPPHPPVARCLIEWHHQCTSCLHAPIKHSCLSSNRHLRKQLYTSIQSFL